MKKHGASHGGAVLVCTIASALLVDVVRKHLPFLHNIINDGAAWLVQVLHLPISAEYINILLYATLLAVIWGAAFAVAHHD